MAVDLIPSLIAPYEKLKRAVWNELVYVTGPPSIGKTTLVKKLFEEKHRDYLHAHIDCFSIKNQTQLLSKVCQAFHSAMNVRKSQQGKLTQKLPEEGATVSLSEFYEAIIIYRTLAYKKGYKRLFIVLDQVEVFERTILIDTLIALARYNIMDIRLIMISCEHPADLIRYVAQKSAPVSLSIQDRYQVVACKPWTSEDIVSWILLSPPKQKEGLYKKFVKNVVTMVTATQTKDPLIIRMYCQEHFEDFIQYYNVVRREQVLKKLNLDLNSSEISESELDEYEREVKFNDNVLVASFLQTFKLLVQRNKDISKWTHEDKETHLTKNAAILIIAAYIAAHTKVADDKWNFIRYQRKKGKIKAEAELDQYNGPFTLERLVQIYLELVKKSTGNQILNFIENNDAILGDIERLKNLEIIHHQSGFQFCSDARYKLSDNIKDEFVGRVAKNHQLSLSNFQGLPAKLMHDP